MVLKVKQFNINTLSSRISNNNKQCTLKGIVVFEGVGVHSGKKTTLRLIPKEENFGIVFERTDLHHPHNKISATFDGVSQTLMSTSISNKKGISVSTVEHLMAALYGLGISNCLIQVDGPEIPIMDGSAKPFCEGILNVGMEKQKADLQAIKILRKVRVKSGLSWAEFTPSDSRVFEASFDFSGRLPESFLVDKPVHFDLDSHSFYDFISNARTFGFYEDAKKLKDQGLAKGADLNNTVVIKDGLIMNEEGLRDNLEFVRHKMLDAIGDIALSPFAIKGTYKAHNASHALNNQLLRALFSAPESFGFETDLSV